MWPFTKKERAVSMEEFAATLAPAPCGQQTMHYQYTLFETLPCPACAAEKVRKQEQDDEDRMAEKIAAAVVRRLSASEVVKGLKP